VIGAIACVDPVDDLAGRLRRERGLGGGSFVAALVAHGIVAIALPVLGARTPHGKAPALPTEMIDVQLQRPPEPPSQPPAPMVETPDTPTPSKPVGRTAMARPAATTQTVPAQAAAVLTSKPDPGGPVDLSDTFVVASAVAYAGGTTSANGTSSSAAPRGGLPGDAGARDETRLLKAGVDRSRRATIFDGPQWTCPFPVEADQDQVDQATVEIRVKVAADGTPADVAVLRDPGYGFAREARRCALSKPWSPALDREGSPVESAVVVNVHFDR
jgi:protein TonB